MVFVPHIYTFAIFLKDEESPIHPSHTNDYISQGTRCL